MANDKNNIQDQQQDYIEQQKRIEELKEEMKDSGLYDTASEGVLDEDVDIFDLEQDSQDASETDELQTMPEESVSKGILDEDGDIFDLGQDFQDASETDELPTIPEESGDISDLGQDSQDASGTDELSTMPEEDVDIFDLEQGSQDASETDELSTMPEEDVDISDLGQDSQDASGTDELSTISEENGDVSDLGQASQDASETNELPIIPEESVTEEEYPESNMDESSYIDNDNNQYNFEKEEEISHSLWGQNDIDTTKTVNSGSASTGHSKSAYSMHKRKSNVLQKFVFGAALLASLALSGFTFKQNRDLKASYQTMTNDYQQNVKDDYQTNVKDNYQTITENYQSIQDDYKQNIKGPLDNLIKRVDNYHPEQEPQKADVQNPGKNQGIHNDWIGYDYTVKSGDTISEIVKARNGEYSLDWIKAIVFINKLEDENFIYPGQSLNIPCNNDDVECLKRQDVLKDIKLKGYKPKSDKQATSVKKDDAKTAKSKDADQTPKAKEAKTDGANTAEKPSEESETAVKDGPDYSSLAGAINEQRKISGHPGEPIVTFSMGSDDESKAENAVNSTSEKPAETESAANTEVSTKEANSENKEEVIKAENLGNTEERVDEDEYPELLNDAVNEGIPEERVDEDLPSKSVETKVKAEDTKTAENAINSTTENSVEKANDSNIKPNRKKKMKKKKKNNKGVKADDSNTNPNTHISADGAESKPVDATASNVKGVEIPNESVDNDVKVNDSNTNSNTHITVDGAEPKSVDATAPNIQNTEIPNEPVVDNKDISMNKIDYKLIARNFMENYEKIEKESARLMAIFASHTRG